ncbi:MAG TPA: DUF2950 family protein [Bryobacteraceae bacterium]|nr:DUF2950 family protein [Bryobacteraceae bacterium]
MTLKLWIVYTAIAIAPAVAQERFDSPEAAAQAVIDAAKNHDSARLTAVLGADARAALTSGDTAQDRAEQTEFANLAHTKHQMDPCPLDANRVILSVGEADWPFPIPIVRTGGKWSFDASQADVEMRARRIGSNEMDVIEICKGYVEAQQKYAEDQAKGGMPEYASRLMSTPGHHDGLYSEGAGESLIPEGLAQAGSKPYHGYYFRILEGQGPNAPGGAHAYMVGGKLMGGFGLVAWPAEYGVTGIHTFIVNHNGTVFEKDIEPADGPALITRFDPDGSWTKAE